MSGLSALGVGQFPIQGVSDGFSGLFWGAALKHTGGQLHTIDIAQKKYDSSKETFKRAGLANTITNHLGDAQHILPTIPGHHAGATRDEARTTPATAAFIQLEDLRDGHNKTTFDL